MTNNKNQKPTTTATDTTTEPTTALWAGVMGESLGASDCRAWRAVYRANTRDGRFCCVSLLRTGLVGTVQFFSLGTHAQMQLPDADASAADFTGVLVYLGLYGIENSVTWRRCPEIEQDMRAAMARERLAIAHDGAEGLAELRRGLGGSGAVRLNGRVRHD